MVNLPDVNGTHERVIADESIDKATRQNDGAYRLPTPKTRLTESAEDWEDNEEAHSFNRRKYRSPAKQGHDEERRLPSDRKKPSSWPSKSPKHDVNKKNGQRRPGSAPHRHRGNAGIHGNKHGVARGSGSNSMQDDGKKGKARNGNSKKWASHQNNRKKNLTTFRDDTDDTISTKISNDKSEETKPNGKTLSNSRKDYTALMTSGKDSDKKVLSKNGGSTYVVKTKLAPGKFMTKSGGQPENELVDLRLRLLNDYVTLHEPELKRRKMLLAKQTRSPDVSVSDRFDLKDRFKEKVENETKRSKEKRRFRSYNRWNTDFKPYGVQGYDHEKYLRPKIDHRKLREGLTTPDTTFKVYASKPKANADSSWKKERSEMQKIRKYSEEDHILTEHETEMYIHVKHVYKDETLSERERRKLQFLKKVNSLQQEFVKQYNNEMRMKQSIQASKHEMQNEELYLIRKRFLEEQVMRWQSQYVTARVLQHEKNDRYKYGLPELFDEIPHHKTRTDKKTRNNSNAKSDKANAKKFAHLFNQNVDNITFRSKTPKMDQFVTVKDVDDRGTVHERRLKVKDVMSDAKTVLKIPTVRDITEADDDDDDDDDADDDDFRSLTSSRGSLNSLDLDDQQDIFEKARQKYGLDVESDDEDYDE